MKNKKPTFKIWIKNMNLTEQIKFYYDVELDNCLIDPWKVLADCAENPNWLKEFKVNLKQALKEREYIS